MGYRICYIASRLSPDDLAHALDLQVDGRAQSMPEGEWWVAALRESGWSILWAEDANFGLQRRDLISKISRRADVIHCQVNETVMLSSCEYWSAGQIKWELSHNGSGADIYDLEAKGKLPEHFDDIREKHFRLQQKDGEDCDYIFEIPLELARSFLEFRHEDLLTKEDVGEFYTLSHPVSQSFFSRIFRW